MLTTEDADAHYDIHPGGQVIGISDIPVTLSFSATVVGEAPSRGSGYVGSSRGFKKLTPCRHRSQHLYPSFGYKPSVTYHSRGLVGNYR